MVTSIAQEHIWNEKEPKINSGAIWIFVFFLMLITLDAAFTIPGALNVYYTGLCPAAPLDIPPYPCSISQYLRRTHLEGFGGLGTLMLIFSCAFLTWCLKFVWECRDLLNLLEQILAAGTLVPCMFSFLTSFPYQLACLGSTKLACSGENFLPDLQRIESALLIFCLFAGSSSLAAAAFVPAQVLNKNKVWRLVLIVGLALGVMTIIGSIFLTPLIKTQNLSLFAGLMLAFGIRRIIKLFPERKIGQPQPER